MTTPTPSYTKGATDDLLLHSTIGDMFDQIVQQFALNEALVDRQQNLRYTYAQLRQAVDEAARGLLALGIQKGDRVGIWSPNRAEWVIAQFATSKIGAILVNINPSYRLHEVQYALNQSGCATLIIHPAFKTSNYTAMLYELCPELQHSAPGQLRSAALPELRTVIRLGDEPSPGMLRWADLLQGAAQVAIEQLTTRQAEQRPADPINIQYTSGTTGFPKGATLSHINILNNGYFVAKLMQFTHNDRLVIPVPLYHCFKRETQWITLSA
jgi:fatty-acyl-CoA synthase